MGIYLLPVSSNCTLSLHVFVMCSISRFANALIQKFTMKICPSFGSFENLSYKLCYISILRLTNCFCSNLQFFDADCFFEVHGIKITIMIVMFSTNFSILKKCHCLMGFMKFNAYAHWHPIAENVRLAMFKHSSKLWSQCWDVPRL